MKFKEFDLNITNVKKIKIGVITNVKLITMYIKDEFRVPDSHCPSDNIGTVYLDPDFAIGNSDTKLGTENQDLGTEYLYTDLEIED